MSLQADTASVAHDEFALEMSPEAMNNPTQFSLFQENFAKYMPSAQKTKRYEHIKRLRNAFHEYNFDFTSKVILCDETAHARASSYLYEFELEHVKKAGHLSIIYYAGHGWRSRDHDPSREAYAYDLISEPARRGDAPLPKGTFIMWERAEHILQEFKHDHLVILDCCDAGFLSNRGPRHAFEYLVACEGKKRTNEPGKHSFTTALIWALKKLKSEAPFTMLELKDRIERYEDFPTEQKPLVFARADHIAGPISFAPVAK
ncbi:hypothetical protein PMIN01_09517 [Paraphaeosphaeria minitans]|uniref:Uncharacterized protein n=1 Tax=Paraphaeosphaeria minitans TaxID=565426 RepID=A0A9P6GC17_9PLEO|nr:hypothetical protein PMIN01_09517 [Paraphaeosphaeria minitans]